jgi:hypothetical protein
LTPVTTSWNNPILIGPLMKASRDIDPMFRTQILGSIAASPNLAQALRFVEFLSGPQAQAVLAKHGFTQP